MDWPQIVFQAAWLKKLDHLAQRRFTQVGLAEEASTYVLERLSEDDWAACKQYQGKAQANTYLQTLSHNFLEEFSRKRFGRPRPPQWLQREGELWVRIWKMVCLERQLLPAVVDRLTADQQRDQEYIHNIARTIKARLPWCGDSAREVPGHCFDCNHNNNSPSASTEQRLAQHDIEDTLQLIHELLLSDNCPSDVVITQERTFMINQAQWQQIQAALKLSPEERLLLKMVYQEGLKLNVVATALDMPSYQPGRTLKVLQQRIYQAFNDAGVDMKNLSELETLNQEMHNYEQP